MNSKQSAQYTLWLDPLQPLAASEHSQLASAGLAIRRIQTLEDLQTALADGQSLALIVRHDATNDLLASTIELMKRMGVALPVVCRIERRHLELAVQAMRKVLPMCWRTTTGLKSLGKRPTKPFFKRTRQRCKPSFKQNCKPL
jgi:hypothetical protein